MSFYIKAGASKSRLRTCTTFVEFAATIDVQKLLKSTIEFTRSACDVVKLLCNLESDSAIASAKANVSG